MVKDNNPDESISTMASELNKSYAKINKELTLEEFSIIDIGNKKNLKRIIKDTSFGFDSAIEFMSEIAFYLDSTVSLLPAESLEEYHEGLNKAIKSQTRWESYKRSSYISRSNKLYNKLIEGISK